MTDLRLRLGALCLALAAVGCVVPDLADLGEKECNEEHPCPEGFACTASGVCRASEPGACNDGDTRACGSNEGECQAGSEACSGGEWSACVGAIGPTAELCDGLDNDCDGTPDDEPTNGVQFYRDEDGDTFGDPELWVTACSAPLGYVAEAGDCDDGSKVSHPGAAEVCDGQDNDCDDEADEGIADPDKILFFADADGDQFGLSSSTTRACVRPVGYATVGGDCADGDPAVFPGAAEVCNGVNDDCDTETDEGVTLTFYADLDMDGYGDAARTQQACQANPGWVSQRGDCDDGLDKTYPGAAELCDNKDNDCDTAVDETIEVALVTTPNAVTTSLSWVWVNGGLSAVYVDSTTGAARVYFQRFDSALQKVGPPADLSHGGALKSFAPTIAAIGSDAVVAWVDEISTGSGPVQRVLLARVDDQGTLLFTTPGADGGMQPARVLVEGPASVIDAPKLGVSADRLLVAWHDGTTQRVRAAVYDGQGQLLVSSRLITPSGVQVLSLDLAAIDNAVDWVLGTNQASAGELATSFRTVRTDLTTTAPKTHSTTQQAVSEVTVWTEPSVPNGVAAAWVEKGTAYYEVLRTSTPLSGGGVAALLPSSPDPISALSVARGTSQTAWAYTTRLTSPEVWLAVGASAPVRVSPQSASAATVAWNPTANGFVVGYESDQGQSLDLYGRLMCTP